MLRRVLLLIAVLICAWMLAPFATSVQRAVDPFGRLTFYPGKTSVACPPQNPRTAVVFVAGQSNVANFGEKRQTTAFGDHVVAFFDGACSIAASPLLGANSDEGESLSLMADELIRSGRFDRVVLAPVAVGGTGIARWVEGDLAPVLHQALASVQRRYKVTHAIWHQGETDADDGVSAADYRSRFDTLLSRWRGQGMNAPVFVSITTRCDPAWRPDNPVAQTQRSLPDPGRGLYRGADTDAELAANELRGGACHHNAAGQAHVAKLLAGALLAVDPTP